MLTVALVTDGRGEREMQAADAVSGGGLFFENMELGIADEDYVCVSCGHLIGIVCGLRNWVLCFPLKMCNHSTTCISK